MATKIKGSNLTDSTFIIPGDLQVDGTTTTINSTTLTVDDKNLVLASGAGNAAAADGVWYCWRSRWPHIGSRTRIGRAAASAFGPVPL